MLKIITHPNPILKQRSQEVTDVLDSEIQALLPEMKETMIKGDGVGLAAPQIGKNIRLFVIRLEDENFIMFNPVIVQKSFWQEWDEEGCLSVPHIFGDVKRNKSVVVEYTDEKNQKQKMGAKSLLARIIQHEIDHLDGILFIERAKNIKKIETLDD